MIQYHTERKQALLGLLRGNIKNPCILDQWVIYSIFKAVILFLSQIAIYVTKILLLRKGENGYSRSISTTALNML